MEIKEIVRIVDNNLLELLELCDNRPMIMMGILTARMKSLSNMIGCDDDLMQLYEFIIEKHNDLSETKKLLDKFR